MFEHNLEKTGIAVSKHNVNLGDSGLQAKYLAENPQKLARFKPQEPQLFGCVNLGSEMSCALGLVLYAHMITF